ncbi:phage tail tip fiber protein [Vreelandella aquamarina]
MSSAVKAVTKVIETIAKPLGKIFSALMPKPPKVGATSSGNELKQVIRSSKEPARYVFGRTGTGALLAWAQEEQGVQADENEEGEGEKGEKLHLVYVLTEGAIEGLDEIYVDQESISSPDAAELIDYELHSDATAPSAYLLEHSVDWRDSQIGRGVTWVRVTLSYDPEYFASGIPDMLFEYRGRNDIYDPRTATNGYSDNAALVILWYIRHRLHVPDDEILWDTFIDAANVCDEIITTPTGSTERRYTVSGGFKADERKDRILADLEAACAGSLIRVGGKFGLQVGAYYGPYELTIDEDMVVGTVTGQTEVSRADAVNTMRGKFVSPEQRWTETDYPAVSVAEWIADDGEEIEDTLDLRFVSSAYQAQRLANIALRRKRAGGTLSIPLNFRGYACRPGRVVRVNLPTLNIDGEFRIVDWDFSGDNGCKVSLQQEQPEIYDDAVGQPFDPFGFISLPTGGIGAPTGLQYVLVNIGEVVQGRLVWNPVDAALHYNVVIKRDGVAVQSAQVPAGVERSDVGGLESGIYTAEVRARGRRGLSSPASITFNINVPPIPDSITWSSTNDTITLTPRLDGDHGRVEFEFRWHPTPLPLNQVTDAAVYLSVGATYTHTGLNWGTEYHYYVRTVNAYGASPWVYVLAETTFDVEQIMLGLTNEIRESHLWPQLRQEIEKISGPEELDGSVAQRLAEEAAQRAQEIAAEAQARTDGFAAEAQARAAELAAQADQFAVDLNAEAQARAAGLADEAQARAAALAAQAQQLTDAINAVDTQTAQAIADEQQARIDALDQERTERLDSFAAEAQARAQAIAEETQNRTVAINNLSQEVETEFGLLSLQLNTISAAYDATSASIYTMTQIRINEAEVVATQIEQLSGRVDDNDALILDERQIRTNQFSSLATQVGILSARLDARPSLNSGFEPGSDFDAWTATSNNTISAVTTGVYSGLQSALITSTDASANPNTGGVRRVISPETTTEFAGHEIRVAVYAEQPDTGAATEFALAYQIAGETVSWQRFTPTAEWAFYDVVVDVPEGTGSAEHAIAVWGDTSGAGNGVRLDRLLVTFAETDIPEVTAAIEQIQQALVDQEQAVAQELSSFEAQLDDNAAAIQAEVTARTTETGALASDIQTLQTETQGNAAAITAEREAWTSETEALAQQINQQAAQIEGGEAALEELSKVSAKDDEYLAAVQRVLSAAEGVSSAAYNYSVETRITEWEAQTVVNEQLTAKIGDNVAAIESEALVRATETEALSQRIDTQTAAVEDNVAAITAEATTRATEDEALSTRIDSVVATTGANTAAINSEVTTRADAVSALSTRIDNVVATAGSNTAAITTEATTRATEDAALSTRIDSVVATAGDNTAAINTEITTRANETEALSTRIDTQSASIAGATAAIEDVRETSATEDEYLAAVQRVIGAAEGVNSAAHQYTVETRLTDKEAQVKVNEQLTAKIGDNVAAIESEALVRATETEALSQRIDTQTSAVEDNVAAITAEATTRATEDEALSTRIDSVVAATGDNTAAINSEVTTRADAVSALSSRIDTVVATAGSNTAAINTEATTRATEDQALSTRIDSVVSSVGDNAAAINSEITTRADAVSALSTRIDTVVATTGANTAAINSEITTRASETEALSTRIDSVVATAGSNTAAINTESTTRANETEALSTRIDSVVATANDNTAAINTESTTRASEDQALSNRIDTVLATAGDNAAAIQTEQTTRASAVSALSEQINTVQVDFNDELASVQQATQAQYNETTGRIEAMWTLRVDNGGRVSGIGLGDDGEKSRFVVIADQIAFAHPTNDTEVFPMIIDSGSVLINDALINKLLFTKLRSSDGSLVFENGKLKAEYIAANEIVVTSSQVEGLGGLAGKDTVNYWEVGGSKPPKDATRNKVYRQNSGPTGVEEGDIWINSDGRNRVRKNGEWVDAGDVTSNNTAADTSKVAGEDSASVRDKAGQGSEAKTRVEEWTRPGETKIWGNQISTADIYVDTAVIQGNAVTVPDSDTGGLYDGRDSEWRTGMASVTITLNEAAPILVFWSFRQGYFGGGGEWGFRVMHNGSQQTSRTAMDARADYPSGVLEVSGIQGANTIRLDWQGEQGAIQAQGSLVVMGAQK